MFTSPGYDKHPMIVAIVISISCAYLVVVAERESMRCLLLINFIDDI